MENKQVPPELLKKALETFDTPEKKQAFELYTRSMYARNYFNAMAFQDFYWCMYRKEPPPYAINEWIPELIYAYENKTGVMLECFRGATKSTTLLAWVAFITGHNPKGSSTFARINDDAAAESGKFLADTIEQNPGWKMVFPYVVPDKQRGWSSNGYYIKDLRVTGDAESPEYPRRYGEWIQICTSDHLGEPSIICAGISSGQQIGKHPSNGWYFDDLHDDKNTRSEREMMSVVRTIESDIVPTWNRPEGHPTLAGACTFWDDNDAYHALLNTNKFKHVKTPILRYDEAGEDMFHGKPVTLAWKKAWPVERVLEMEDSSPVQFARMYLCDLELLKGLNLKKEWIHKYPYEKMDTSAPVYFGVDYASTIDKLSDDRHRDYFSVAFGRVIPSGGVVLFDGYHDIIEYGKTTEKMLALASQFPTFQAAGIEKYGSGEKFYADLLMHTSLNVIPCPLKGTPTQSKGVRFQEGMAPMFSSSRAWMSDVRTPFLDIFYDEWISWDGKRTKTGHDDALDSAYWMLYVSQRYLMPSQNKNLERRSEVENYETRNPYNSLGNRR